MKSTAETLWAQLAAMEDERRFAGKPYPDGMCALPFRLAGQGFFPGGDGLWRNEDQLACAVSRGLPSGGITFVGNDFGTLQSYQKLRNRGYENPPTWRHLKARIARAGLPPELCFCTNAIMGLRTSGSALDKRSWQNLQGFADFCREFFAFQLKNIEPKLIVILGPNARTTADVLLRSHLDAVLSAPETASSEGLPRVLYTTHPYADFSFSEERKTADAVVLKAAWDAANGIEKDIRHD